MRIINSKTLEIVLEYAKEVPINGVAVEIGTYYGYTSREICKVLAKDAVLFSFQSPSKVFNHNEYPPDLSERDKKRYEELHNRLSQYDKKFHGKYNFNVLVEEIKDIDNMILVLKESPLNFNWLSKVDFIFTDIGSYTKGNLRQVGYWVSRLSENGTMILAIAATRPDRGEDLFKMITGHLVITGSSKFCTMEYPGAIIIS